MFPMILRSVLTTVASMIGAEVLLGFSCYLSRSLDYSQEDTVGVITWCGWPFHCVATAPGWSHQQFDLTAYYRDWWLFFAFAAAACLSLQLGIFWLRRRPNHALQRTAFGRR